MDPDYDHDTHSGPPEYFGDDTRLTSRKELSGWYSYGWAAEVFVICGIGTDHVPLVSNTALNLLASRRVIHSHHLGAIGSKPRSAPVR